MDNELTQLAQEYPHDFPDDTEEDEEDDEDDEEFFPMVQTSKLIIGGNNG